MGNILKIDVDLRIDRWGWIDKYKKFVAAGLKSLGYGVEKIVVRESDSKKGLHIWIHLDREVDDRTKNMLQFLCCDDRTRVRINYYRIEAGVKNWNKLFSKVLYRRPLEPPCSECRLIKYLKEVEERVDNEVCGGKGKGG